MTDTQTPIILKIPKTVAKAEKVRMKRVKRVKVKTEVLPPSPETLPYTPLPDIPEVTLPIRLPCGLRASWQVSFKDEDDFVFFHSLRDVAYGMRCRGVDIPKTEKLRAFLRRSGKKTSRRVPAWISSVKSVRRLCRDVPDYTAPDSETEGDGANDGFGATDYESEYFSAC
jgi:hypothetical protein